MGLCWKCGAPGASETDDLCDSCYEQVRWEEISAINCNPQVDEIKLEGMDAVYAYEDDHPQCRNCGERLNTVDGCHCGNPIGPDDD